MGNVFPKITPYIDDGIFTESGGEDDACHLPINVDEVETDPSIRLENHVGLPRQFPQSGTTDLTGNHYDTSELTDDTDIQRFSLKVNLPCQFPQSGTKDLTGNHYDTSELTDDTENQSANLKAPDCCTGLVSPGEVADEKLYSLATTSTLERKVNLLIASLSKKNYDESILYARQIKDCVTSMARARQFNLSRKNTTCDIDKKNLNNKILGSVCKNAPTQNCFQACLEDGLLGKTGDSGRISPQKRGAMLHKEVPGTPDETSRLRKLHSCSDKPKARSQRLPEKQFLKNKPRSGSLVGMKRSLVTPNPIRSRIVRSESVKPDCFLQNDDDTGFKHKLNYWQTQQHHNETNDHVTNNTSCEITKESGCPTELQEIVTKVNIPEVIRTEVNRTDVNRTDVNRTDVNRTDVNRTEVNIPKANRTEVNIPKVNRTEVNRTEVNRTEVNRTEVNRNEVNRTEVKVKNKSLFTKSRSASAPRATCYSNTRKDERKKKPSDMVGKNRNTAPFLSVSPACSIVKGMTTKRSRWGGRAVRKVDRQSKIFKN